MPLYTMLLDAELFHRQIVPALAKSWRLRTFVPCQKLATALLPAAEAFAAVVAAQDVAAIERAAQASLDIAATLDAIVASARSGATVELGPAGSIAAAR